jgi:hypothetical protein
VIISPLALKWFARVPGINWMNLSNIGQTYGAISALLSALALGGVAVSLLYQARDLKTAREQTSCTIHQDLLQIEMKDPFYMEVMAAPWGRTVGLNDYDALRRNHFIHMWVSFWEGQYVLGELSEKAVRSTASSELFVSAYGRKYWSLSRIAKLENNTGRRLQFIKIVDEEYGKATESGLPVAKVGENRSKGKPEIDSWKTSHTIAGALVLLAAGGSVLGKRLLSQYLSRRS